MLLWHTGLRLGYIFFIYKFIIGQLWLGPWVAAGEGMARVPGSVEFLLIGKVKVMVACVGGRLHFTLLL